MFGKILSQGRGLFEVQAGNAPPFLTNMIRTDSGEPGARPGSRLIAAAALLLAALDVGLLYVSFSAQRVLIFNAKHLSAPAVIEALALDAGLIIFSLLGLGLSRAGLSSRTERLMIVVCAFASAAMNYAGADQASARSILVYTVPPVFLAIVTDRLIAVVRRHVLGDTRTERSVWAALGHGLVLILRAVALAPLYVLRLALACNETVRGMRQWVLNVTPLPEVPGEEKPAIERAQKARKALPAPKAQRAGRGSASGQPTKKAVFLAAYRKHQAYGDRKMASRTAAELAAGADIQPGRARSYIYEELRALAGPVSVPDPDEESA